MPRGKEGKAKNVEAVDLLPNKSGGIPWIERCMAPYKNRNRWYRVHIAKTPEQALNAQSNLTQRHVNVPDPDGEWTFASRGCEVFAKYLGPGKKRSTKRGSVRRTQSKR